MDKLYYERTDYSVVVKNRAPPPKAWRWEIYRAGNANPIKQSPIYFDTTAAARRAGKDALKMLLNKLFAWSPSEGDGIQSASHTRAWLRAYSGRAELPLIGNRWRDIQLDGAFITLLGGAVAASPLAARASSRRKNDARIQWRLSYLSAADFGANNSV
jgi:hypothetical protein